MRIECDVPDDLQLVAIEPHDRVKGGWLWRATLRVGGPGTYLQSRVAVDVQTAINLAAAACRDRPKQLDVNLNDLTLEDLGL